MKHINHFLLLVVLLFNNLSSQATINSEESRKLMHQWEDEFNQYLLKHDNPDIRAYGVFFLTFDAKEQQLKDIYHTIKYLSSIEKLSDASYALITHSCFDNTWLNDRCYELGVFDKYINNYPTHLNTYFIPLELALKNQDDLAISQLLTKMSDAEYNNEWILYSDEFEQVLESYLKSFPYPNEVIEFEIKDNEKRSRYFRSNMKEFSVRMSDYFLLIQKIGISMAMPMTKFRRLDEVCENKDNHLACIDISNIMIDKSLSLSSRIFGYNLKIKLLNKMDQISEAKDTELKLTSFTSQYQCLMNLVYEDNVFKMNLNHEKSRHRVNREKGELAGLVYAIKLKYEEIQKTDPIQAESYNPESCLVH